jgi:hypothetical protein
MNFKNNKTCSFINEHKYFLAAMSYGTTRKYYQCNNTQINSYDSEYRKKKVPLLNTQKVAITVIAGVASIYLWPHYLYKDMKHLEIYLSNKNINDFGYFEPNNEFDLLLN